MKSPLHSKALVENYPLKSNHLKISAKNYLTLLKNERAQIIANKLSYARGMKQEEITSLLAEAKKLNEENIQTP